MATLAIRYRPKSFEELVGQTRAVRVVRAISEKREPQVLLLEAQHGVGKTTLARIFAKSLNCEFGSKLCGECKSCLAFNRNAHPDIYEIDCGSSGLVADARKLRVQANVVPTWKCRVFVLDEVHSASAEFFNSMLALLEEPPPSAYFVMCTTQTERVPFTILSRALCVELDPVPVRDIEGRLGYVVEQEGFSVENKVLWIVAKYARGSLRDALMALERMMLISENKRLTMSLLESEAWFASQEKVKILLRALTSRDHELFLNSIFVSSRLEAVNIFYDLLDKLSVYYVKKQRKADSLIEALWRGYVRVIRGADPELALRSLWLESEK